MKPKPDSKVFVPERTEDHVNPMRSMFSESRGETYRSYANLAEAVDHGAHVILQGDYGGQIYFTCPATKIECSEPALKKLLDHFDSLSWKDAEGARIYFEDRGADSRVPGGMGGGLALDDMWLHPELQKLGVEAKVRAFVSGLSQEP